MRRVAVLAFAAASLVGAFAVALGVLGGTGRPARSPRRLSRCIQSPGASGPTRRRSPSDRTRACFQQAFGNVAYREGPQAALALVERTFRDGTLPACHQVVHAIGSASLARSRNDVGLTFAQGAATCGSGYYHGVLERALVGAPNGSTRRRWRRVRARSAPTRACARSR